MHCGDSHLLHLTGWDFEAQDVPEPGTAVYASDGQPAVCGVLPHWQHATAASAAGDHGNQSGRVGGRSREVYTLGTSKVS